MFIVILSGCADVKVGTEIKASNENTEYVNKAIDEVKTTWEKRYADMYEQTNTTGYLKILALLKSMA